MSIFNLVINSRCTIQRSGLKITEMIMYNCVTVRPDQTLEPDSLVKLIDNWLEIRDLGSNHGLVRYFFSTCNI